MPIGPVAFENTPSDVLVPAYMVEFNAGPPNYSGTSRQIVLGRAIAGSPAAVAGVPVNVGGQNPNAVCGYGSMGAEQLLYARRRNPIGEMYFLDVGAPSGSPTPAVGAVAFAGTADLGRHHHALHRRRALRRERGGERQRRSDRHRLRRRRRPRLHQVQRPDVGGCRRCRRRHGDEQGQPDRAPRRHREPTRCASRPASTATRTRCPASP